MSQRKVKAPVKEKNPKTVPFDMDELLRPKAAPEPTVDSKVTERSDFEREARMLLAEVLDLKRVCLEVKAKADEFFGGNRSVYNRKVPDSMRGFMHAEDDSVNKLFWMIYENVDALKHAVENRILQLL